MSEPGKRLPRAFEDLVPWADPYIAALLEKLRHADCEDDRTQIVDELPPPLDNDEDSHDEWRSDRSTRGEPQE